MNAKANGVVSVDLNNNDTDYADVSIYVHDNGADWRFDVTLDKSANPQKIYSGTVQYSPDAEACFDETTLVPSAEVKLQYLEAYGKAVAILRAVQLVDGIEETLEGRGDLVAEVGKVPHITNDVNLGIQSAFLVEVFDRALDMPDPLVVLWATSYEEGEYVCKMIEDNAKRFQVKNEAVKSPELSVVEKLSAIVALREQGVAVIEEALRLCNRENISTVKESFSFTVGMRGAYQHALEMMCVETRKKNGDQKLSYKLDHEGLLVIHEAFAKVAKGDLKDALFPMTGNEAADYLKGLAHAYRFALDELVTIAPNALSAKQLSEAYPVQYADQMPKEVSSYISYKAQLESNALMTKNAITSEDLEGLHHTSKLHICRSVGFLNKCDDEAMSALKDDDNVFVRIRLTELLEQMVRNAGYTFHSPNEGCNGWAFCLEGDYSGDFGTQSEAFDAAVKDFRASRQATERVLSGRGEQKDVSTDQYQLTASDQRFVQDFSGCFGTIEADRSIRYIKQYHSSAYQKDSNSIAVDSDFNHFLDAYLLWGNALGYAQTLNEVKTNDQAQSSGYVFAFPGGSQVEADELLDTLKRGGNDVELVQGSAAQACLNEVMNLRQNDNVDRAELN